MPYELEIVELAPCTVAGIGVRTDMQNALKDCPALWQAFMPHMLEIGGKPAGEFQGESFGLSQVVDLERGIFDYFAAMPWPQGKALPAGFTLLNLQGGVHVRCKLVALRDLPGAYTFIYKQWLPQQAAYAPSKHAFSFEHYTATYLQNGCFELCVPLLPQIN